MLPVASRGSQTFRVHIRIPALQRTCFTLVLGAAGRERAVQSPSCGKQYYCLPVTTSRVAEAENSRTTLPQQRPQEMPVPRPQDTRRARPDSTSRLKPGQLLTQPAGGEAEHPCSPLDNTVSGCPSTRCQAVTQEGCWLPSSQRKS